MGKLPQHPLLRFVTTYAYPVGNVLLVADSIFIYRSSSFIKDSLPFLMSLLQQVADFELFTLDDIDAAFQNVVRLKYSQNHLLNGQ